MIQGQQNAALNWKSCMPGDDPVSWNKQSRQQKSMPSFFGWKESSDYINTRKRRSKIDEELEAELELINTPKILIHVNPIHTSKAYHNSITVCMASDSWISNSTIWLIPTCMVQLSLILWQICHIWNISSLFWWETRRISALTRRII
jgi:hypothetical protein